MVKGLLRFTGAVTRDRAIPDWFAGRPRELSVMGRRWFAVMRAAGDDVREVIHDGCPVVCVDDAPFAYVNVFTAHVNVGFFHGDALPDPKGILLGTGRFMRHVKLRPGTTVDESSLEVLIRAAYQDIRVRVRDVPKSTV